MEFGVLTLKFPTYVEDQQVVQQSMSYNSINKENSTFCGNPADYGLPRNWSELETPDLIYGIPNFDNIVNASLTVFQSLTTEGWSTNMYLVREASFCLYIIVFSWI